MTIKSIFISLAMIYTSALYAGDTVGSVPSLQLEISAIRNFYVGYLNLDHSKPVPEQFTHLGVALFSSKLRELIQRDDELCVSKSQDFVCGWNSDIDPFLDTQDTGDNLNFANSGFQIEEVPSDLPKIKLIEVRFNLFPGDGDPKGVNVRKIRFVTTLQRKGWFIDDMLYFDVGKGQTYSLVQSLKQEIEGLLRQN